MICVVVTLSGWISHGYEAIELVKTTVLLVVFVGLNEKAFGANPYVYIRRKII